MNIIKIFEIEQVQEFAASIALDDIVNKEKEIANDLEKLARRLKEKK